MPNYKGTYTPGSLQSNTSNNTSSASEDAEMYYQNQLNKLEKEYAAQQEEYQRQLEEAQNAQYSDEDLMSLYNDAYQLGLNARQSQYSPYEDYTYYSPYTDLPMYQYGTSQGSTYYPSEEYNQQLNNFSSYIKAMQETFGDNMAILNQDFAHPSTTNLMYMGSQMANDKAKKQVDALNKEYGTDYTAEQWQDIFNYTGSDKYKNLNQKILNLTDATQDLSTKWSTKTGAGVPAYIRQYNYEHPDAFTFDTSKSKGLGRLLKNASNFVVNSVKSNFTPLTSFPSMQSTISEAVIKNDKDYQDYASKYPEIFKTKELPQWKKVGADAIMSGGVLLNDFFLGKNPLGLAEFELASSLTGKGINKARQMFGQETGYTNDDFAMFNNTGHVFTKQYAQQHPWQTAAADMITTGGVMSIPQYANIIKNGGIKAMSVGNNTTLSNPANPNWTAGKFATAKAIATPVLSNAAFGLGFEAMNQGQLRLMGLDPDDYE